MILHPNKQVILCPNEQVIPHPNEVSKGDRQQHNESLKGVIKGLFEDRTSGREGNVVDDVKKVVFMTYYRR